VCLGESVVPEPAKQDKATAASGGRRACDVAILCQWLLAKPALPPKSSAAAAAAAAGCFQGDSSRLAVNS